MPFLAFTAGFELLCESERLTHSGEVLAPVMTANLNLVRADILKGLDVTVSLTNLANAQYREPVSLNHVQGSIDQDRRRVSVGLTWRSK